MATNEELAALVQGEHTDAVIALEQAVAAQAAGQVEEEFEALSRSTVAAWVAAFGSVEALAVSGATLRRILKAVRAAVRRLLGPLGPRAQAAIGGSLAAAVLLGARQHEAFVSAVRGRRTSGVPTRPNRTLRDAAAAAPGIVAGRRDRALSLLRPQVVRRWTDVLTGIGAARSALPAVRAHVAWVINQAVNHGLVAGIRAIGARKLWVAEADACVNCAAYAGLVVDVGEPFPGGLSWDPTQRGRTEPIDAPPLHPHCRCRTVAWKDAWAVDGLPSLPEALTREARRSVARGWSLPTESGAARIRAARELLRTVAGLPESVEEYAALAVRQGRFADRTVPTGP
ncbi:hypothetical protein [Streptomyces sp. NPDC002994]|uniref:hypothetical protein n=1 Tax=Streptomyces sp. NPDC002994 TaxID=3154441 RepID=UPI0033A004EA